MRALRYFPLSDNNLSKSSERPGKTCEALWRDGETWDTEQKKLQHKLPDEHKAGTPDARSDGEQREKIRGQEHERVQRENEWLRCRLSAAKMKLQKLENPEDRTCGSGGSGKISSNRSSKMRCSVLGRKKNKWRENEGDRSRAVDGRISPSDASTVVMGSKSKSKSTPMNDKAMRHNSVRSFPKKNYGDTIWSRYLGVNRRDLSPRPSGSQTPDVTPPCTPERSTPERSPSKDNWLSSQNKNKCLISPLSSNTLRRKSQERARIHRPQPLGIEACLSNNRNETRREREDMFMSFRTAVISETFTGDRLKAPDLHEI